MPHEDSRDVCPSTGRPIDWRSARRTGAPPSSSAPSSSAPTAFGSSSGSSPRAQRATTPPPRGRRGASSSERSSAASTTSAPSSGRAEWGRSSKRATWRSGAQVAIKVLHANQLRKKDSVRRFHQEARSAGAIGHPNICEVYDLGTLEDGCPYLVMEKLVGETLADRIASEGGLPVRRGRRYADPGPLGPRRRAREGDRPPGHQAGERLPHEARRVRARREAVGLRRLEDDPRPACRSRRARRGDDPHRDRARDAVLPVRPSRRVATATSTRASTSTRAGSCSTRRSPAGGRSPPPTTTRCSSTS